MELLIPGLILVALMVYASTRIKRSAAQAFEEETVDTAEFSLRKPEGFLNILNGDQQYAFEAYSKDFAPDGEREVRAATAKLRIVDGETVEDIVRQVRDSGIEITNELNEVVGDIRYHIIDGRRLNGEAEMRVMHKLAERGGRAFDLEIAALVSAEETARRAETFIDSFEVK